jgi:hypothetical protein
VYDIETVAFDWVEGALDDPVRRLKMPELIAAMKVQALST